MIRLLYFIFISLCVIVYSSSCSEDVIPINFTPKYSVPKELQPIIDRFILEASENGQSLIIDNMIIEYSDSLGVGVCGTCNSNYTDAPIQKIIKIRSDELVCWNNNDELEALLYHELGHCILGRLHTNYLLPNGDPKSLMIENNISVYSACVYDISGGVNNCNLQERREYYIEELFDETTPIPDWAN